MFSKLLGLEPFLLLDCIILSLLFVWFTYSWIEFSYNNKVFSYNKRCNNNEKSFNTYKKERNSWLKKCCIAFLFLIVYFIGTINSY